MTQVARFRLSQALPSCYARSLASDLGKSKEITAVSVVLYVINNHVNLHKLYSFDFLGFDNVYSKNYFANINAGERRPHTFLPGGTASPLPHRPNNFGYYIRVILGNNCSASCMEILQNVILSLV